MLCIGVRTMLDYATYIRTRITELRMKMNVSEYQMSLDLGMNRNYIQGITSGKALPSMAQFLEICDYFQITPMQFFDDDSRYPQIVHQAMEEMRYLGETDMSLLLEIIHRFRSENA